MPETDVFQITEKDRLNLICGHLVRMRTEAGNLKTAIDKEEFLFLMNSIEESLRYVAVLVENYVLEENA